MTTTRDLLIDGFERIAGCVHSVLDGLTVEGLSFRPDPRANSIGWLIWHLSRIQDDHVASAADKTQVWTTEGWAGQFALPFDLAATGYGQDPAEVAAVRVDSDLLVRYHDAVHAQTIDFVRILTDSDLDRIVDRRWNPPVTLGVRLVSVLEDDLQHVGQAAYVRGMLERR